VGFPFLDRVVVLGGYLGIMMQGVVAVVHATRLYIETWIHLFLAPNLVYNFECMFNFYYFVYFE